MGTRFEHDQLQVNNQLAARVFKRSPEKTPFVAITSTPHTAVDRAWSNRFFGIKKFKAPNKLKKDCENYNSLTKSLSVKQRASHSPVEERKRIVELSES